MMKRLFTWMLALCMLLSLVPVGTLAEDTLPEENTCQEGCVADTHAEGCPNASDAGNIPAPVADPGADDTACTKTEGCILTGGHDTCQVPQLVARIVDGGYFEELLVSRSDGWAVLFFLKTGGEYTYIEDVENITASGVATLTRFPEWDNAEKGWSAYLVGGSALGTGAITYKGYSLDVTCGLYRDEGSAILAKNASGNYLEMGHFFTNAPQNLQFYLADSPLDEELTLVEFTDLSKFKASGDNIKLEYVEANTVKVSMTSNADQNYITYKPSETKEYTFRVWWLGENSGGNGGNNNQNNAMVTLDYQDGNKTVPVTVGISANFEYIQLNDGGMRFSYNKNDPADLAVLMYLGALVDFGENTEQPAPQGFYDKISDVRFYFQEFTNMDGSNSEACNGTFEEENLEMTVGAAIQRDTVGNILRAKGNALFKGTLAMSFVYEEQPYEISVKFMYDCPDVTLDASELLTAAELNAVLASSDALLEWFAAKNPAAYDNYMNSNRNGFIDIYLPAAEYDDIIVANPVPDTNEFVHNSVRLHGHEDGTSMVGLHVKGNVWQVQNIDFIADKDKKMTLGNKDFTCGILGENANMLGGNEVGSVLDCTFTGFDYGVRSTGTGYIGGVNGCEFVECENGIYIDCGDGSVSGWVSEFAGNTFVDNKVALTIRNLPAGITPYKMNVQRNLFLSCQKDFKITTPGNPHYYYFYKNYYGNAAQTFSTAGSTSRSAQIALKDDEESAVASKAIVVTNPRLVYPNDYNTLGIDSGEGLHSVIINAQAGSLLISGQALDKLTAETEIGVVVPSADGLGATEIGKWTFGGE